MVSSFLWRRLYHLHDLTKIPFLLVGDFRQIPPVEDMIYEDYREHPTLINLCKNSYIELEKIHRYDEKLAELTKNLDDMMLIKKTDFKRKVGKVNICYLNKTRKKINTLLNSKLKPDKFVISKKLEWINNDKKTDKENKALKLKYDEDNQSQDIFIYEGMPMISRLNCGDKLCNNEKFVVKSIDNDIITLTSTRANDDGIEEEHIIEMDLDRIQLALLCCYCMTTHKSQGITISGAVTIHDWDMMDKKLRYTAITRVKKYENIYMV
jgi:ATP-dependent exoDNAse (exonuclease V) alpha subunit